MRTFILWIAMGLLAVGVLGWWRYSSLYPKVSQESVYLTPHKRYALKRLRDEAKFEPHKYPPLGYTGIANPEDGKIARSAVNELIDAVLSQNDRPIASTTVSDLIGKGMNRVSLLDTEDRDRTGDYMIEIWYLLGFKGPTGRFANGGIQQPGGYGEPLPPGWKSPTEPRPIGEQ